MPKVLLYLAILQKLEHAHAFFERFGFVICIDVVGFCGLAGLCFMVSTNAQDQEQALQAGFHGQENLLMRKPNLLFLLVSLMGLNGSNYNHQICLCISTNKIIFLCKRHNDNSFDSSI